MATPGSGSAVLSVRPLAGVLRDGFVLDGEVIPLRASAAGHGAAWSATSHLALFSLNMQMLWPFSAPRLLRPQAKSQISSWSLVRELDDDASPCRCSRRRARRCPQSFREVAPHFRDDVPRRVPGLGTPPGPKGPLRLLLVRGLRRLHEGSGFSQTAPMSTNLGTKRRRIAASPLPCCRIDGSGPDCPPRGGRVSLVGAARAEGLGAAGLTHQRGADLAVDPVVLHLATSHHGRLPCALLLGLESTVYETEERDFDRKRKILGVWL